MEHTLPFFHFQQMRWQINFAIIKEASKGNYAAWIGSILLTTNVDKYYNYLKELGFEISLRYKGEHGVYVIWG